MVLPHTFAGVGGVESTLDCSLLFHGCLMTNKPASRASAMALSKLNAGEGSAENAPDGSLSCPGGSMRSTPTSTRIRMRLSLHRSWASWAACPGSPVMCASLRVGRRPVVLVPPLVVVVPRSQPGDIGDMARETQGGQRTRHRGTTWCACRA